jgi:hypothetical protein
VRKDTYVEFPAEERKLPWRARRKLRKVRQENRTGMLAYSQIPGGSRAAPWITRIVAISEGGSRLFFGRPGLQTPQWVDLSPGNHFLKFSVGGWAEVDFARTISLNTGDILIAGCKTTYTRNPFNKNPPPNKWYIGVMRGENHRS